MSVTCRGRDFGDAQPAARRHEDGTILDISDGGEIKANHFTVGTEDDGEEAASCLTRRDGLRKDVAAAQGDTVEES